MQPSFLGTKIVDDIDVRRVIDAIDRDVLFAARWQLKGDLVGDAWAERVRELAEPTFQRISALCFARGLIKPRLVYGHFACERNGNLLFVKHEERTFRFDFPRERQEPHRCLADFFPDGFITMMLVTVGNEVAKVGAELFKDHKYTDTFYLKGFAAEAAEALARLMQAAIAREIGLADDAGVRFSFGYPSCPNLMDQKKLMQLLRGARVGVTLSPTMQLHPEYSTSAIISFDAKAGRFIP